jgi:hypothetical protein
MSDYYIINIKGHYEAYDLSGNFILSGDTYNEIIEEMNYDKNYKK